MKKKIGLVGAGNIGGTLALLAAQKKLGDVLLLDVAPGLPQGKALDLCQMGATNCFEPIISGSNNMADLKGCNVVIITAGLPRKPGMRRDDLLKTNSEIIGKIALDVKKYCPDAFVIVVTNPLDAMVWHFQKVSGLPSHKVVGMAGILDSSRFEMFLAQELNTSIQSVSATVLGGHGDTMVPLLAHSYVGGISLESLVKQGYLSQQRLDEIVERTRKGGGEIVSLLKNGSAFYAPAASAILMAESYLHDLKLTLPCAAHLTGQYGVDDLYVGVPIIIGANGVEKIIEYQLNTQEKTMLDNSVQAVQDLVNSLKNLSN
tara:strand:+ start:1323 stop:2273 length:951 start_codon:yes stop_codon:yes gene_type:complete